MADRRVKNAGNNRSAVSILPLSFDDIDLLIALAGITWRKHYPGIISVAQIEYMLAQRYNSALISEELQRADACWDVLWVDGVMTAFASYFPGERPRVTKLDKIYVQPDQQRKGYGGMLIDHVCKVMYETGCDTLMLAVNKRNVSAIAAYRKRGFRIAESVTKDIGGGFVMDDYVMVKRVYRQTGERVISELGRVTRGGGI
jgi:diamine N-acetyltransferase